MVQSECLRSTSNLLVNCRVCLAKIIKKQSKRNIKKYLSLQSQTQTQLKLKTLLTSVTSKQYKLTETA